MFFIIKFISKKFGISEDAARCRFFCYCAGIAIQRNGIFVFNGTETSNLVLLNYNNFVVLTPLWISITRLDDAVELKELESKAIARISGIFHCSEEEVIATCITFFKLYVLGFEYNSIITDNAVKTNFELFSSLVKKN